MMNHRHGLLLVLSTLSIGACTSEGTATSTTAAPAPSVAVSADRSLDVSYSQGMVELSFARLGNPFRSMYTRMLSWDDRGWRYYGMLRTGEADTVGTLTTEAADQVVVLDGANTARAPDRYRAPALPAGRYLVCTELVEPDNHREVCGELSRG